MDAFAKRPGVTTDQAANASVINHSPALVDRSYRRDQKVHLKHIVPLPAGTHAGSEYNGTAKEMRYYLSMLTSPPRACPSTPADAMPYSCWGTSCSMASTTPRPDPGHPGLHRLQRLRRRGATRPVHDYGRARGA